MWGSCEAQTPRSDPALTRTAVEDSAGQPALPPPPHRLSALLQHRDPDRYELLGEHGRGGLGTVTRAHDKELGRNVAIKELIKRGDAGEVRFLREAMITARLEHPGIVPVHEAGQWPDGTPFYVMKLVAGRSLKDVIASCSSVACRMALLHHVVAVADAVAYAHKRKIIHRDLKPANVIVGDFGETVVIDWGLAKDLSELDDTPLTDDRSPYRAGALDDVTQAGSVLGTPMYMAPEQWRGERVDQRADVFAIGAMLWELCSRHRVPPTEPRVRDKLLRRAGIDADLGAIISKALSTDPADRYQNAGELASDLRAFTSGARIASRRYSLAGVAAHWIRHHRAIAAIAGAALVLGVIGATIYVRNITAERTRAEHANDELVLQNAALLMQRDPTAVIDTLATYRGKDKVRADLLRAEARGRGVADAHFKPHSDSVHFLHGEPDGSVYSLSEDRLLRVTKNGVSTTLASDVSPAVPYDFAASKRLLAYGASPTGIALYDLVARTATRVGAIQPVVIALSDDGLLLAALDVKQQLTVWSLPGHEIIHRTSLPDAIALDFTGSTLSVVEKTSVRAIAFAISPPTTVTRAGEVTAIEGRGGNFVIGNEAGQITLLSSSLETRAELRACRESVRTVRLAPPDRIAFTCAEGLAGVARLDATGTALSIELTSIAKGQLMDAAIDETGRRLIVAVEPSTLVVSDLDTKLTTVLEGQPAKLIFLATPRPDFDRIVAGDADGNVRIWRLPATSARRMLAPSKALLGSAISPDGSVMATAGSSGIVRRVDLATGRTDDLEGHKESVFRTRFAPDGRTFLSLSFDGTVRIWGLRGMAPVRVFAAHRGRIGDAEYTPRGDRVVSVGDDGQVLAWSTHGSDVSVLYSHGAPLATHEVLAHNDHVVVHDADNAVLDIAPDGAVRRVAGKSDDVIRVLRASADGRLVAVGRASGRVLVYDTADYRVVHESTMTEAVYQVQFDPKGRDLVIQADSGMVRVIPLTTGRTLPWRELAIGARDATYSADGDRLAFICVDGTWFYSIAENRWTYARDHSQQLTSGRFAPSDSRFFSTDATGVVVVRDLAPTPLRKEP